MISPLAFIDPDAQIGKNVTIHPFAYVDKNVVIGDNNVIMPHVSLLNGTRMGNNNTVYQGAVISAVPQDFNYKGDETITCIGNNNTIRENVVINKATTSPGRTEIGDGNFLMQGCRVSHDVIVGNECIIGNNVQLAGCSNVDDRAIISMGSLVLPGCHIGSYAMMRGGYCTSKDIPPYIIAAHDPIEYHGINTKVLLYQKFPEKIVKHIASAYRLIYQSNTSVEDALMRIKEQVPMSPEIEYIIQFISQSKLGIIK